LHPDTIVSVVEAGLHYSADFTPGITRKKLKSGFKYYDPEGKAIVDQAEIKRINKLAIPPAYTDVWICPDPLGFLQATGRDARGRKQYRYHERWRTVRDETKYARMLAFASALPRIRERVDADLARSGMPREKVLATVIRLLETTRIRVGNEEYAKENNSYGLTTLQNEHVVVNGSTVHFHFRGKSGKEHVIDLRDKRLARIVKKCQELPGQELFKYVDENGALQSVGSSEVNAYLREISGDDFTAKDFRTWAGTVLAAMALQEFESFDSQTQAKKNVVRAIESVAKRLGNTPSVCRKCYVHPAIIDAYVDGSMLEAMKQAAREELSENLKLLQPEEAAVVALVESRLSRQLPLDAVAQ
jgi:DNA topoisomerase-1